MWGLFEMGTLCRCSQKRQERDSFSLKGELQIEDGGGGIEKSTPQDILLRW